MRIGLVAPPWVPVPPPHYGGTEAIVDSLARGFQSAGHEVLLWTVGNSMCPVPSRFCYEHDQSERIGTAIVELRHVINGYGQLIEWGADIIHDHTMVGPIYSHRFKGIPVVSTNHGPFNLEATDIYSAASPEVSIIAISEDQRIRAHSLPIARVIHHGIDVEDIEFGRGQGDDNGQFFMFLGRMAPEKGLVGAIEVARRTGTRLLIAAKMREPAEKSFFVESIEPLLDDRIVYLGEVDHDEKLRLLRGASALINPIRWPEPFGLVMIEALASGTPVVTLPYGAAPEIVRDGVTGLVCSDLDDLVSRLPEVQQISRAACRLDAAQRFSTARMVEAHLDLYGEILNAVDLRSKAAVR